ncbi:uncharacterized protein L969DRAFT_18687 [Mixia osmundae IAM 14324]|nr:uncharacterized protein L969DRAFT_18687 [Mixia osmundae IAM 14324]KEI37897.1 hypothetical protein L969DRAFT_18687 [Mixia osmundae IAM 14324]
MSEETRGAALAAPRGLIAAIGCSSLFGLLVLLSFLFSIQDYQTTIDSPYGQPVLQIFVDAVGENGAIVMMTVIMICVFHCGLFSVCSNSRMYYSFARDSGIPKWFATVDKRTQAPVKTIWLAVLLSFCLALPSLGSTVAFTAATSIATSGLYISYGIPIALGLVWPHHFQKGPFTLGILSKPIAAAAVMWVICITIFFCLPTANPVTSQTLNYCPVAIGVIALYIAVSWTFWARKYFVGPVRAVDGLQVAPADATDAYAHLEIGADNKLAEKDSPIDETEKESL